MKVGKKIGYGVINIGRKAFVGTPVQKMKLTSMVYAKIFKSMYGDGDVTTQYKDISLTMPTKDTTIVPSILGGYFESLELDIFTEVAKSSKNVIDVGGNIGLFSIIAAKKIKSGGKVFAFEPVTENVEYFQKNVIDNRCSNIVLVQEAIGERQGDLDIYVSEKNIAIHSASKRHSGGSLKIKVPMTTVDDFVKGRKLKDIDILKIDIEGYDGFALRGAIKTIKDNKPTVFIEYDPRGLRECGFTTDEFADLLFSQYEYCLRVNEMEQLVTELKKDELLALPVVCNENLIFTNNKKIAAKYLRV